MMASKYRVFIWDDVLTDYSSGCMFAVAKTVEEARKSILKECNYVPAADLNIEPKVYELSDKPARAIWGGG